MQSTFTSQTLVEVFRDLFLAERTGILALSRDDEQKQVYFERGLIHFADSSLREETLGPQLVAQRQISSGALAEAERGVEHPLQLARALVNRGLIGRESLTQAVLAVIGEIVQSLFQWDQGTSRFTEEVPDSPVIESDVLMTFETILAGVFQMSGFEPVREAMFGLESKLRVRQPRPLPLERLKLSPSHGFILSRVDGTTTVREILSLLPPEEESLASRFLFGMISMGVLEYDPPLGEGAFRVSNILRNHADRQALERMQEQTIRQAYDQMRTQNPYEILGVTASASREAIERAYEEAKSLFSRDRILPRVREKHRSELAVIESRLVETYLRLTQVKVVDGLPKSEEPRKRADEDVAVQDLLVRVEMDKTKSKIEIEEATKVGDAYYAKARKAMREGDFHNAVQYAKLAISYNDKDARFYHLLADCQERNPEARWQRMAEQNYAKATELDPWNVDYWLSLGRFYKRRGLKLRARKQYEEVLKLVPAHKQATQELEGLS